MAKCQVKRCSRLCMEGDLYFCPIDRDRWVKWMKKLNIHESNVPEHIVNTLFLAFLNGDEDTVKFSRGNIDGEEENPI